MRIAEVTIYGFGKWKDFSISLAEDNVNLIFGQNEAGKSTLYQFILFMLFGLSPKQREFFRPKSGGTLGGELILATETYGRVRVERLHDRQNGNAVCHLDSGEAFGEEWLQHLLGGTGREVYESIFSFNAGDLLRLQKLSGDDLGEILLNIGLTGSDQIYQTEKWLEKNLEDRFKPKGKKPQINDQLQRVEELYRQKKAAESEEDTYQTLRKEKEQWASRVEQVERELKEQTKNQYKWQQLLKARPILVQYHLTKHEASRYADPLNFPESGKERYQQIKESILPLESEKKMLESRFNELQRNREELHTGWCKEDIQEAVLLLEQQQDYERASHDYQSLSYRCDQLREHVIKDLKHLDVPIEEQELNDYSLPFYIEETWRDLKNEHYNVVQEEGRLYDQEMDLERELQKVEKRQKVIDEEQITDEQARHYETQVEKAYQTAADRQSRTSKSELQKWRTFGAGSAVIVLVLGGFLQSFYTGIEILFIPFLLALVLAGFAYKSHKSLQKLNQTEENAAPISYQSTEEARHKLQQYEKLSAERSHLLEQWKNCNQEEIRLQEKRNHLLQRKRRVEAGIDEQKHRYPFLTSLHIDHWEKLYHLLTKARDKWLEYQHLQEDMHRHERTMTAVRRAMETLYQTNQWDFSAQSMNQQWKDLARWVHEQEDKKEQQNQTHLSLQAVQHRLKENEIKLQAYLAKREELFQQAGVTSEEAFYQKAKRKEEQEQVLRALRDLEQQVRGMLSEEEEVAFKVWSQVPEEAELHMELDHINNHSQRLEEERQEAQQALADIKISIKQLENSDKRSEITQRFQMEQAKLQEQAKEWTQYQFALQFLKQTKGKYKEKYLPHVLQVAESHFTKLTNRNYDRIRLSSGSEEVMVGQEDGMFYAPEELSRGTRDQLYVAFRLALGETMAGSLPMPFLVDDAFVHFDQTRLQVILEILENIASRHQVILFTWRNDVSSNFKAPRVQELQ